MNLSNPYIAGNPVGGTPQFIGRADVLREVLRVLRQPAQNAIVLYGQRRIGKTSVLQQLTEQLPKEGPFHSVYFDLQDKAAWALARVLTEIARTIADAFHLPVPNLGDDPAWAFHKEWLPAVLKGLSSSEQNPSSLVLLFDEFDVLADPKGGQAGAELFPYLRQLMALDPVRLQFVFVIGRKVEDLESIALSLFKGTPALRVSLLAHDDTLQLARLSEQNETLHWAPKALEKVWELTHGHPFLTQQLCSRVWENLYNEDPSHAPAVLPEDVEQAIHKTLEASRNTMEWIWGGLPPAERVVISALAKMGNEPITQEQLEQMLRESGVRVVIRELQNAPQLLQDWDLLEPVDGGFEFKVELLRRWLLKYKPLSRVQEELDRLIPLAENLYQAAMAYYREEKFVLAENQVRQAIISNPNHIRANELLAEILISRGDIDEAIRILTTLNDFQPNIARPRLIPMLLKKAEEETDERLKLRLHTQILELDSINLEAKRNFRDIWKKRGDKARHETNFNEALLAYEKAEAFEEFEEIRLIIREKKLQELSFIELDNSVSEKNYQDSLALVENLKSEYSEDTEFQEKSYEIIKKLNLEYVDSGLNKIHILENAKSYSEALNMSISFSNNFPSFHDWQPIIERLKHKTQIPELYGQGLAAFSNKHKDEAKKFFAEVTYLDPDYSHATAFLHKAKTGTNFIDLSPKIILTILNILALFFATFLLIGKKYVTQSSANAIAIYSTSVSLEQTQSANTNVQSLSQPLIPVLNTNCQIVFSSNSGATVYESNIRITSGDVLTFTILWTLENRSLNCSEDELDATTFYLVNVNLDEEDNLFTPVDQTNSISLTKIITQENIDNYQLKINFTSIDEEHFSKGNSFQGISNWQLVYARDSKNLEVAALIYFDYTINVITSSPTPTPTPTPYVILGIEPKSGTATTNTLITFTLNFYNFNHYSTCIINFGDETNKSFPCKDAVFTHQYTKSNVYIVSIMDGSKSLTGAEYEIK